ncbi:hypothetical protein BGZ70_003041 [Mortierella alpina]|uniref:mRNA export factor GLE1 n=1 Tax=Mortierella alpina TaxID=64518 RepID=A0A9P6JAP5_MORAP|nr:hypothetical protein BGZ70_003041 [Mortierella alpina]
MSANQGLPFELILRHSITEGHIRDDDPELAQLRLSKGARNSLGHGIEDVDLARSQLSRHPLSQSSSIYYQNVGLASTVRAKHRNGSNAAMSSVHNGHRATNKDSGERRRSGYGLVDFSSEDEDSNSDGHGCGSDQEDGADDTGSGAGLGKDSRTIDPNSPAHYVAHITGRMDPWELKMQKLQESGKELAPVIADKITNDFNSIAKKPQATQLSWAGENDDIIQKIRNMSIETEAIKEKRRKETEALNQAMENEFAACLARIKEERETALRIREEAIRKANLEKERLEKEAEEKKKAEVAAKEAKEKKAQQEAAEMAKKAAAAAATAASNSSSTFVSDTAEAEWQHYTKIVLHLRTVVKPGIVSNRDLKKICFEARREIVPFIGQLFNKREQVMRVAMDIDQVFKRMKQTHGENPYNWLMNETGKKFLEQIENEALVKSAPAFPVAHVAVLLFTNHPRFLDVLMARFVKKCPYVIPKYFAHDQSESTEQYFKKLGYKHSDGGWEKEDKYNARQCAIFTLYCAILQTNAIQGQNAYPLSHGWTWMARIVNMPPWPITPSLINVFLEVCGDKYMRTYGNQARKVIQLLVRDFIPLMPKKGVAGTTRLKTQLEGLLKDGYLPPAEGREFDR